MGRSLPLSDSLATCARASGHADAADARSDVLKTVRRTGAKTTECLPISAGLVLDERVQGSTAALAFLLSVQSTCRPRPSQKNANEMNHLDRKFCIAPMMEWTDRHCRFFHRLLTRRALIYTEMITTGAVLHGERARLLAHDPAEHPVALQLGGCDPRRLAECARIAEEFGYDEVNLNVGCPSDRVQVGRFGACLMAEPALVGDCVAAMTGAVKLPVTVKCRIGIDDQDPEEALEAFACAVEQAGVAALIVHARKAWLDGLSPRENRDIPPLDYARVYRLKAAHPGLAIVLNGGIADIDQALEHLGRLDGVMMGRAAYQDPWRLLAVDPMLFGEPASFASSKAAAEALIPYIERELARGTRLNAVTRHVLGLFRGVPGARAFRRHLATEASKPAAGAAAFRAALALVVEMNARMVHSAAA
jgi:tRNA-dihydrouridine synthase A